MNRKLLSIFMSVALLFGSFGMAFGVDVNTSAAGEFSDMPNNWSTAALNKAVENDLLVGYAEGGKKLIKAGNPLTRAEMATVVNRVFASEKMSDLSKVSDVSSSSWYAQDMAKAVKMGTFSFDNKMRPNDKITRQEAFTVLARAFKLVGTDSNHKALDVFSDKDQIADWALNGLDGMTAAGYIQGYGGKLNPKGNITRAEFATVMDNLVKDYIDTKGDVTKVAAKGNVVIRTPGVVLKDVTVKGDLIIADGVGEGDVTLDNVTVEGRTVVRGGGENSVIVKGGSQLGTVIVAKVDGVVRVFVEGGAEVDVIYVDDGSDDVIVEGKVNTLEVAGEGVTVYANDADIDSATVSGDNSKVIVGDGSKVKDGKITGDSSAIVVDEGGSVDSVDVTGANATIGGDGEVGQVAVAEGVEGTEVGGKPVEGGQTVDGSGDAVVTGGGIVRPPVNPVLNPVIEVKSDKGYYAAGDILEFTISGFTPNTKVRVGMPISVEKYNHPQFNMWASDQLVLTEGMVGDDDERYWVGYTNQDGELLVKGKVGEGLPYGPLCITLPDYKDSNGKSFNIDNTIGLNVEVGTFINIDGIAAVKQKLTAKDLKPDDIETPSYKWLIADTEDGVYEPIGEATTDTYTPTEAGKWIKVVVTGTKDGKDIEASAVVGPILSAEQAAALAAIKPKWELINVEAAGDPPDGVVSADYKVTIETSYPGNGGWTPEIKEREVTTYFTLPHNFVGTVYYPVWVDGALSYGSATEAGSEVAYGMVGHPLKYENIEGEGVVYVSLGDTEEREFWFGIRLEDAAEGWEGIVYGEEWLPVDISKVGEEAVALAAINSANEKGGMKAVLEEFSEALGLELEEYNQLQNHEASWASSEERELSVANYVIDKRTAKHDNSYGTTAEVKVAFDEGVAYEKGKLDFHAVVKNANVGDSLKDAIAAVKDVYSNMAANLGIEVSTDETLSQLMGMLTGYLELDTKQQGRIDDYVLVNITGNDRLSRDVVFGTMAHAFNQSQVPEIITATAGKDGNNLVLTVTVTSEELEGLYALEVDHSHGEHGKYYGEGEGKTKLPEFWVYAWEEYPCGSEANKTAFNGQYGVYVEYAKAGLTWTIIFKPGENGQSTFLDIVNDENISNGIIEFYLVAHNINGKSSGYMGGEQGGPTYYKVTYNPNNGE